MNELDAKIDELRKIDNKEILIAEVVILLQNLQKDFNHAMLSKDADILILEATVESKTKEVTEIKMYQEKRLEAVRYEAIIKYLEGKLDATFN